MLARVLHGLLLLALSAGATAETAYVIDRLLMGIHESQDTGSAILKVVPTGTAVEVLKREGDVAQVSEPGGTQGWVDAAYLSAEMPARQRVTELEKDKAALEARMQQLEQAARGQGGAAPANAETAAAEIDLLTKENTELKGRLSEEKLRAGTLQTEVTALRTQVKTTHQPPDARLVELERSRDDLEKSLQNAERKLAEYAARAELDDTAALVPVVLREYAGTVAALLLVLAVLAFGAGVYVVDLMNRRRHGGFRV
ncbi:MAG: TIGR04211 family SH3 domain-containing protein [Gammaproteobacteria bacterium]